MLVEIKSVHTTWVNAVHIYFVYAKIQEGHHKDKLIFLLSIKFGLSFRTFMLYIFKLHFSSLNFGSNGQNKHNTIKLPLCKYLEPVK